MIRQPNLGSERVKSETLNSWATLKMSIILYLPIFYIITKSFCQLKNKPTTQYNVSKHCKTFSTTLTWITIETKICFCNQSSTQQWAFETNNERISKTSCKCFCGLLNNLREKKRKKRSSKRWDIIKLTSLTVIISL